MIGREDKKQFKVHGIRFARSLQMLVKMVNMFSAVHKSAAGMLQRNAPRCRPPPAGLYGRSTSLRKHLPVTAKQCFRNSVPRKPLRVKKSAPDKARSSEKLGT